MEQTNEVKFLKQSLESVEKDLSNLWQMVQSDVDFEDISATVRGSQ